MNSTKVDLLCTFTAKREHVVGLITIVDLMDYITKHAECEFTTTSDGCMEKVDKKLSNLHISQASDSNNDTWATENKITGNNSSTTV